MFDHLLESSQRDDSNNLSNIGFGEEICIIEIKFATYQDPKLAFATRIKQRHF